MTFKTVQILCQLGRTCTTRNLSWQLHIHRRIISRKWHCGQTRESYGNFLLTTNKVKYWFLYNEKTKLKFDLIELGMDDEAKIYFTEHIFLEQHLESWCPTKGPVRHFMELVCVGLSKNPYYTVAQKKEHIEWFRDYFAEKKELLDSVIIESVSDTPKELQ